MRTLALLAVLMFAGVSVSSAKVFTINVGTDGTNAVLSIGAKPCSPVRLSEILAKLSSYSTNMQVDVRVETSARATDLVQVIHLLQQSGLHNVAIFASGTQGGKTGYYHISIDCTKRPIGGCIADFFVESGFHPDEELDGHLEAVTEHLERPAEPESSQQEPEHDK